MGFSPGLNFVCILRLYTASVNTVCKLRLQVVFFYGNGIYSTVNPVYRRLQSPFTIAVYRRCLQTQFKTVPLPLAHAVVGYAFAAASGVRFRKQMVTAVLFSVVVANLPDLDFIPGALANEPVLYHRTIGHTLPAAVLCGLIIAAVVTRFGRRFWEIAFLGFMVYSSHLLTDMLHFGGGNIGVQILWPVDQGWYTIKTPLMRSTSPLLHFQRGQYSAGFFASLLSYAFVRAAVLQALLFMPLLLPAWWIRARRFS
jgi:membrane-bound metal-dependent hydrolase YbcI (DUF457 family)